MPSHGSASLPLFSTLLDWFLLKDVSQFISVFLGSCNFSRVQEMLQVLGFFRTDSAPWQDLASGQHGKKTPMQLELLPVPAFLQRGENLCLPRAFMGKKK